MSIEDLIKKLEELKAEKGNVELYYEDYEDGEEKARGVIFEEKEEYDYEKHEYYKREDAVVIYFE